MRLSLSEISTVGASFAEDVAAYSAAGLDGIGIWEFKLPDDDEANMVLLREAGHRLVAVDLPVRQDRHRGYHDSDPDVRDKESRKTYDRFLQRFRGREDLRLPAR